MTKPKKTLVIQKQRTWWKKQTFNTSLHPRFPLPWTVDHIPVKPVTLDAGSSQRFNERTQRTADTTNSMQSKVTAASWWKHFRRTEVLGYVLGTDVVPMVQIAFNQICCEPVVFIKSVHKTLCIETMKLKQRHWSSTPKKRDSKCAFSKKPINSDLFEYLESVFCVPKNKSSDRKLIQCCFLLGKWPIFRCELLVFPWN